MGAKTGHDDVATNSNKGSMLRLGGAASRHRNIAGVTLIETMIALVLVAIIAAIALPSYQAFVKRGHRAEARDGLMRIGILQEKYKGNHAVYANSLEQLGLNPDSVGNLYRLQISSADAKGFTALATPTGRQAGDECTGFVLNERGPVYTSEQDRHCWGH